MRAAIIIFAAAALCACDRAQEAPAATGGVAVVMQTTAGDIELRIDAAAAPLTAANFLALVDGGHLDGGSFYRTVSPENDNGSPPIAVIQGGLGDAPSPFAPIEHETTAATGLRHADGAISMARGPVGTASTEFFICIGAQPALDFGGARNADGQGFAVFGRVTGGMEVVHAIHESPATASVDEPYFENQILDAPVRILRVRRL